MTCTSGNIQQLIDQRDHFYQALLYIQRHLTDTEGLTSVDKEYIDQSLMAIDLALMELPPKKTLDDHLACPSYPNCDEDPNRCRVLMGDDVEPYGNRD